MGALRRKLRAIPRVYVIGVALACALILAGTASVIWQEADMKALKEAIRTYFSASEEAERTKAWEEIVRFGASDFEFLLWGLENTNSVFMFEPGKLDELFSAVEQAAGADAVLAGARNALGSEMSVAKNLAMDLLLKHRDSISGDDIQDMRSILMNSQELAFSRMKAASTLAELKPEGIADDFASIVNSVYEAKAPDAGEEEKPREVPLALRELCLELLSQVALEKAMPEAKKILESAESGLRLVKRAVGCAVQNKDSELLASVFAKESDSEKKAAIANGLVRLGDAPAQDAIKAALALDSGEVLRQAVLDAISETGGSGLEDVLRDSLASASKAVRLRAIRAAKKSGASADLTAELDNLRAGGSPEEQYLIDRVGQ